MPLPKEKFHEVVFGLLYSHDLSAAKEEDMIPLIMSELSVSKKSVLTAQEHVRKIIDKLPEIDSIISKTSQSYAFERIQSVERNILRWGVYELLFEKVSPKTAIAEAVRLTRKFGSPESATFVHAILSTICQQRKANAETQS